MPAQKKRTGKFTEHTARGCTDGWRSRKEPTLSQADKRPLSEGEVNASIRSLKSFVENYCYDNHFDEGPLNAWRGILTAVGGRAARQSCSGSYSIAEFANDLTLGQMRYQFPLTYKAVHEQSTQGLLDAYEQRCAAHVESLKQREPARRR